MHDKIKKFTLKGQLSNKGVFHAKDRLVHHLEGVMRDRGHVPSLDLDPQFSTEYLSETDTFDFSLSVYGIWVGREEACKISGITNGKPIMKFTGLNK